MAEIEGKGLDYERFALRKLFRRFVDEFAIRSVLELPGAIRNQAHLSSRDLRVMLNAPHNWKLRRAGLVWRGVRA